MGTRTKNAKRFALLLRQSVVAGIVFATMAFTGATGAGVQVNESPFQAFDDLASRSQQVLVRGGLVEPQGEGFFCFTGCLTDNDCTDGCICVKPWDYYDVGICL